MKIRLSILAALLLAVLVAGCAGMTPPPPPPPAPAPVEPKSAVSGGETVYTLRPVLEWQAVPGADGYAVYVSELRQGEYRLIYSSEDQGRPRMRVTSFRLPPNLLRDGGQYRWNVRAWNHSGWSPYSATYRFRVQTYTDRELESVVRDALRRAPSVDADRVTVRAQNGEVTLSGCAVSGRQIDLAREVTAAVGGVRRVHNSLRVCR